jgi:CopG family nickel-responsive transcriptional regulator
MKQPLTRFGVAIEAPLLRELDALVRERNCSRSELLRDLARAEIVRSKVRAGMRVVATLTLVYDHHVRDLSENLTALQHELGDQVHSTLHVHLNHDYCLEVIVMRGLSNELQAIADRILATRGVKHGGLQIITGVDEGSEHGVAKKRSRKPAAPRAAADSAHGHAHAHPQAEHRHPKPRVRRARA